MNPSNVCHVIVCLFVTFAIVAVSVFHSSHYPLQEKPLSHTWSSRGQKALLTSWPPAPSLRVHSPLCLTLSVFLLQEVSLIHPIIASLMRHSLTEGWSLWSWWRARYPQPWLIRISINYAVDNTSLSCPWQCTRHHLFTPSSSPPEAEKGLAGLSSRCGLPCTGIHITGTPV